MEAKSSSRITAEAVLKAVTNGAKSPTAVAKTLGYKSGSSGVIKNILKVVPDLRTKLQALNVGPPEVTAESSTKNTSASSSASPSAYPIPECVPYRPASGYVQVWSILFAHRKDGITKKDLIEIYQAWSGKPQTLCGYDVQVVASPTKDGGCNRSAAKASEHYWVERKGDLLKLHLVDARG